MPEDPAVSEPDAAPAFPGPAVLGRGAVVLPGRPVPAALADAPRLRVDPDAVAAPAALVAEMQPMWTTRRPYVVELACDQHLLAEPERHDGPVHAVPPDFTFRREQLNFLVWANNWDLRRDVPVWWWARKATRHGAAAPTPGATCDVVLADGRHAYCDGGPHAPLPDPEDPALDGLPLVPRDAIDAGVCRTVPPYPGTASLGDELTAEQRAAVLHPGAAARVVAPAGSGKTTVLTARIRHLLDDRGVDPSTLVAVAYNRKAADELRARVAVPGCDVRTIHSLGMAIRTDGTRAEVIDERGVRRLLSDLVDVPRRANQDPLAPYVEALAEVRIGLRDPLEVEAVRDDVPGFAEMFDRYRSELADRGLVDHDEQVHGAVERLLREPDLRRRWQRRCRHLLVDEFQDLTPAYLLLLRLLAAPAFSVFGVGDDDQVIYGYAGADPRFLLSFPDMFPGAGAHALTVNWRCPPAVVRAADHLLAHNRVRIAKELRAAPDREDRADAVRVLRPQPQDLATAAGDVIGTWIADGAAPDDVAVLARVHSALLPVQAALHESGVAVRSSLGPDLLARTGMRSALAYLRIALAPDDVRREDVAETLRRPSRRVNRDVVAQATRRRTTSLSRLREVAAAADDRQGERLDSYVDDCEMLATLAASGTTADVLTAVRDRVGLGSAMRLLDSSRGTADRSGHGDDLDALLTAAALCPEPSLFAAWLHDVLSGARPADAARTGDDAPAVLLSSVHKVKGREWPHVLVFGAHDGLFPHGLTDRADDAGIEEERRVFHVAVTRAATDLVVMAAADRPVPFVDEMSGRVPVRAADEPRIAIRRRGATAGAPASDTAAAASAPSDDAAAARWEQLRTWRRERAATDGVPAFVVMIDRHLLGIAEAAPTSMAELSRCAGIGPTKLDRYGDEILAVVDAAGADVVTRQG